MPDVLSFVEQVARRRVLAAGGCSRFVDRVHALDIPGRGSLPPVVLLHGFSAAAATQYGGLIQQLRPQVRRIIAPELPGHGASALPPEGLSPEALLQGLRKVLDGLLDEPAVLFASSLGGAVAVRYAGLAPRRLAGLMLCSPGGAPVPASELEQFLATFRIHGHREALAFVDRLFPMPALQRHAYAWGLRRQFSRAPMQQFLRRIGPGDFLSPHEVASLPMPVFLLWGEGERVLPPAQRAFFLNNLPAGARVATPPSFGHAPFLNHPRAVARYIVEFARSV